MLFALAFGTSLALVKSPVGSKEDSAEQAERQELRDLYEQQGQHALLPFVAHRYLSGCANAALRQA
jgi:hypothetical protein